jgi:hypothetical protein
MRIEILHPVHHGVGKGKTIIYGRGLWQTDDAKRDNYIPPELAEELLKLQGQGAPEGIARLYRDPTASTPPQGKAEIIQGRKR